MASLASSASRVCSSSRVKRLAFEIAIAACSANDLHDAAVVGFEWPDLEAVDVDLPEMLIVDEHPDADRTPDLRPEVGKPRLDVVDEDWGPVVRPSCRQSLADVGLAGAHADDDQFVAFPSHHAGTVRVTQPSCFGHDAIEDSFEIAGVGADELQDLGGSGLEFERFGEVGVAVFDLAEQAGVVDGDRGLVGERLEERDLVGRVAAWLLPREADRTDGHTASHHRYRKGALVSRPASWRGGERRVCFIVPVGDVNRRAADHRSTCDRGLRRSEPGRSRPGRSPALGPLQRPRSRRSSSPSRTRTTAPVPWQSRSA